MNASQTSDSTKLVLPLEQYLQARKANADEKQKNHSSKDSEEASADASIHNHSSSKGTTTKNSRNKLVHKGVKSAARHETTLSSQLATTASNNKGNKPCTGKVDVFAHFVLQDASQAAAMHAALATHGVNIAAWEVDEGSDDEEDNDDSDASCDDEEDASDDDAMDVDEEM